MKYIFILLVFAACSNGNGPERPPKRIIELMAKNEAIKIDTVTIDSFNDTDTIIYVLK